MEKSKKIKWAGFGFFALGFLSIVFFSNRECGLVFDTKPKSISINVNGTVYNSSITKTQSEPPYYIFSNYLFFSPIIGISDDEISDTCELIVYNGTFYAEGIKSLLPINKKILLFYDNNKKCSFDPIFTSCNISYIFTVCSVLIFVVGILLLIGAIIYDICTNGY
jgi:hypothetical protein